ncbi:MAG: addiction module protein [Thermoanaerobaculia bacterium]
MTGAAKKLRNTLMELSEQDRAWLASELIASLDGPPDPDAEDAWAREIHRRAAEIELGTVKPIAWKDVKARLDGRLRRR